jgi:tetratricopeptide (TPR) repeat protein
VSHRDSESVKPILLAGTVIGVLIVATVLAVKVLKPQQYLKKILARDSRGYTVTQATENLPVLRGPLETISVSEMVEVRRLLVEKQFDQLNAILAWYQKGFGDNPSAEYALYDAYKAFDTPQPDYAPLFQEWIAAAPDHYQPYLAAAQYHYARGWDRPRTQVAQGHLPKADRRDAAVFCAVTPAPGSGAGHQSRPDRRLQPSDRHPERRRRGGRGKPADWRGPGPVSLFPAAQENRRLGQRAPLGRQLRGDGAHRQPSGTLHRQNPRLGVLYGFVYCDQGRYFTQGDRSDEAIRLCNQALSFGDHWYFYYQLARVYHFDRKQYDLALEHINKAIAHKPTVAKLYRLRSRIQFARQGYGGALEDIETTEMIRPGDAGTARWVQWAANNLLNTGHRRAKTDQQAAVDAYSLSLDFNDGNPEAYYWRGMAYSRMQQFGPALTDFQAAVRFNPRYFDAYRMIDALLARERQWERILAYWNAFLELEPGHAEAYFERSGTHYHNRDMASALADLDKACRLGSEAACQQYRKVGGS